MKKKSRKKPEPHKRSAEDLQRPRPLMFSFISKRFNSTVAPRSVHRLVNAQPELEIKRIVPSQVSYYSPNSDHESNILELQKLNRKFITLPKSTESRKDAKWLTLQQYEPIGGGERLKPSQHKALVQELNKLNSIDDQLKTNEIIDILMKYSRSANVNEDANKVKSLDNYGRSKTTGGRKSSSALVYLVKGTGEFLINGKTINQVFPDLKHRQELLYPFKVIEAEGEYNVFAKVTGGGPTGQVGAIVNAIGKGLIIHNPLLKPRLYKAGCMTRDHRRVERKKPGKVKARKSPTWVKR